MKNRLIYLLILILAAGGIYWYAKSRPTNVIAADTTIKGDYEVKKGEKTVLQNGSTLTVEGNFTVKGKLSCDGGPLQVVVKGNLRVEDEVGCQAKAGEAEKAAGEAAGAGIRIVAQGGVVFSENSRITSDGDVQIVESEGLLAKTSEAVEKLYQETGNDSGAGQRIGPFTGENETAAVRSIISGASQRRNGWLWLLGITSAKAAGNTVVVGGKVVVATPPPGVKRIVVFNFPGATGLEIKNFELTGPNGRSGADDKGKSCTAKGKDGEDAFRFLATAGNMTVNNFTLNLGSGGKGGDAETTKNCDPGTATGGAGGKSGNFKMIAANEFKITGAFVINPGKGGAGGTATAYGKDGGPSEKGGDAIATGGKGADNKKQLAIVGDIAGTNNVQVGSVYGGDGGSAAAKPGKGGDGIGCGKPGGPGGNGTATGGKGGKASVVLAGGVGRTPGAEDVGGKGGDADSYGAQAGKGGDCGPEGPGGNGGKGGDAKSTKGAGGEGTTSSGQDGAVKNETGGNGGNGGDGCPEGSGGKGGVGNPPGTDGKPGKNLCKPPVRQPSQTTPPETPPPTQSTKTIPVIEYQGKYLPVQQLIVESEVGCGAAHWHAAEGVVRATDGTYVPDPGPPCGYGKQSEKPVLQVQVHQ